MKNEARRNAPPKEELIYPPKVWSHNTPKAQETGEPEEIDYDLYLEAKANSKPGDRLTAYAGAPGVGHITREITRIDDTGVYGIVIENTIWVPGPEYFR